MDWRLIGAVSAAGCSFSVVAVGAYFVLATNPGPQRTSAPAPMLLSEYRFPATTTPSLVAVEAPAPSPFAPQDTPAVAAVAPVGFGTTGAALSPNPPRDNSNKGPSGRTEPRQEPRVTGYKTAAVTPFDGGT